MQLFTFSRTLSQRQSLSAKRGLGGVLVCALVLLGACDDKSPQTRQSTAPLRSGSVKTSTPPQAPGGGYVESSENATERSAAVERFCKRKASIEPINCWMAEVERTHNRKLDARIALMLYITPDGRAEKVEVSSPQPELQSLEQCVADAARSWSYPEGTSNATVRCDFHLRSSQ
ncbi:MAG: hypothetical protein JNM40_10645 [Myxococcales bacterium]|nr:hypothetical protein [Myxococcales bacterium]